MCRAVTCKKCQKTTLAGCGQRLDPVNFLGVVDDLRNAVLPGGGLIVHRSFGVRGHLAVRILAGRRRDAANLDGGYKTWRAGMDSRA